MSIRDRSRGGVEIRSNTGMWNRHRIASSILIISTVSLAEAENWPAWRGSDGLGITQETGLPIRWSTEENVLWRVDLPEPGNSTPIVWNDRLFLTQPVDKDRTLLCFDRKTGTLLWKSGTTYTLPDRTHPTNPYCSPSPVTDGERVYTGFGSAGVFCYDFDGKEFWKVDLGVQDHEWGSGTSPILFEDLLILQFGPGNRELLVALNKKTGKEVWRVDAPHKDQWVGKDKSEQLHGSWSTPLIIKSGDRDDLVVYWPHVAVGYNPKTGEERWRCEGFGDLVYANPAWGEGVLVALGGYGGPSFAFRPEGEGDLTEARLWWDKKSRYRLGAGIIREGHLYVPDMGGLVQCYDLLTGDEVWNERLFSSGAQSGSWSSLVLSEDNLYLLNKQGDTFIFKASPKFELVATNSLGEPTNSSVVPAYGNLFIRTHDALWCIGGEGEPEE